MIKSLMAKISGRLTLEQHNAIIDAIKTGYAQEIAQLKAKLDHQNQVMKTLEPRLIAKDKQLEQLHADVQQLTHQLKSSQDKYDQQIEAHEQQRIKEGKAYQNTLNPNDYCITERDFPETDLVKAKAEMRSVFKANDMQVWTDAQAKMIFSSSRLVNVIAGAGSGKTTTMIARIIYMIQYLNIDIDHITVITFTKSSREDFTAKLAKAMQAFGHPYDYKYLWQNTVKTFHAKMLNMAKLSNLSLQNIKHQIFEHLDMASDDEEDDQTLETDVSANIDDLLKIPSNVGSKKYAYLMHCYFDLYNDQSSKFKTIIEHLYDTRNIKQPFRVDNKNEIEILESITKYDRQLTEGISQFCIDLLKDDQSIIPEIVTPEIAIRINTGRWRRGQGIKSGRLYANFYLSNNEFYVVFIPQQTLIDKNETTKRLFSAITTDHKLFNKQIKNKISWLEFWLKDMDKPDRDCQKIIYVQDLDLLKYIFTLEASNKKIPPIFNTAIQGEEKHPETIFLAIYTLGSYLESLSLDLATVDYQAIYPLLKGKPEITGYDANFLEATLLYFKHLTKLTRQEYLYRYNELFQLSGAIYNPMHNSPYASDLRQATQSMQHVLIDEFQDISPLIAKWVAYYLRSNVDDPSRTTSLMFIGDNWQCIYGFRGSVPTYLSRDYQQIFPAKQSSQQIILQDNFRSAQKIIDHAQTVFANSTEVRKRGGISRIDAEGRFLIDDAVVIDQTDETADKQDQTLRFYVEHLFNEYKDYDSKTETDYSLFVLCTTRKYQKMFYKILQSIAKRYGIKIPHHMRVMTIHKSKGLEAQCVLAVGDKDMPLMVPLKQHLYRHTLGGQFSHNTAQTDEYKNIIYVALSRAKEHVIFLYQPSKYGIAHQAFKSQVKAIKEAYQKSYNTAMKTQ